MTDFERLGGVLVVGAFTLGLLIKMFGGTTKPRIGEPIIEILPPKEKAPIPGTQPEEEAEIIIVPPTVILPPEVIPPAKEIPKEVRPPEERIGERIDDPEEPLFPPVDDPFGTITEPPEEQTTFVDFKPGIDPTDPVSLQRTACQNVGGTFDEINFVCILP